MSEGDFDSEETQESQRTEVRPEGVEPAGETKPVDAPMILGPEEANELRSNMGLPEVQPEVKPQTQKRMILKPEEAKKLREELRGKK